jgi:hypothetical protein
MKEFMEHGKNPDEIDAEHPEYLHKCSVDVYQQAMEQN